MSIRRQTAALILSVWVLQGCYKLVEPEPRAGLEVYAVELRTGEMRTFPSHQRAVWADGDVEVRNREYDVVQDRIDGDDIARLLQREVMVGRSILAGVGLAVLLVGLAIAVTWDGRKFLDYDNAR